MDNLIGASVSSFGGLVFGILGLLSLFVVWVMYLYLVEMTQTKPKTRRTNKK